MKAITLKAFGSVDNFALEEVEQPVNPDNNLLIKIKATAFNPIDYQMRQGATESKLLKSPILGRELSGIVTEVGQNVKHIAPGAEIVAYVGSLGSNGTYTEYISIPQVLSAFKPSNISFEEACAVPMVGLTALQCYDRLSISKKQSVFIAGGAGGVGTMLIKLLVANGINQFITTAGGNDSKAHLLQLGVKAENIINYKNPDFIKNILDQNQNQPFDFCIDLVGGRMSEVCSEIIKVNGCYADITNLTTNKAREQLFDKGIAIFNISNYAYTLSGQSSDTRYYGEKLTYLMNLIQTGKITAPPIHIVGDLNIDSVREAHLLLEKNQANGKKIVMKVTS